MAAAAAAAATAAFSTTMPRAISPALCFCFFFFILLSTASATPLPAIPSSSAISAAPSFLPDTPKVPAEPPTTAAFSPDITPLFPSPRRGNAHAPDGGMPTIPSNPSPPNPDVLEPGTAEAPLGSARVAAMSTAAGGLAGKGAALGSFLVAAMCWLYL